MYQLPELANAICDDKRRAAEHHRLPAPAYPARRNGTWRGIALLTSLRLRLSPAAARRAARGRTEMKYLSFAAASGRPAREDAAVMQGCGCARMPAPEQNARLIA